MVAIRLDSIAEFTSNNSAFETVNSYKNPDPDKYFFLDMVLGLILA